MYNAPLKSRPPAHPSIPNVRSYDPPGPDGSSASYAAPLARGERAWSWKPLGYTAEPVTYTPLSSRGLGRRILSPETRVRIPVAVPHQSPADAGLFYFWRRSGPETLSRFCPEKCIWSTCPRSEVSNCGRQRPKTAALHGKRLPGNVQAWLLSKCGTSGNEPSGRGPNQVGTVGLRPCRSH
jgi:hypothetical protein